MTEQSDTIQIYQDAEGRPALEVKLDQETVWLTQKQMALLFDKDSDTIGLHIRNIYKDNELQHDSTTEESSVVQLEGSRNVTRKVFFYNLDVIISVGYRVKSQQGIRFRQWATKTLRNHLVKGYTVNEQRLREQTEKLNDLRKTVTLLEQTIARQEIGLNEAKGLLAVKTGEDTMTTISDSIIKL